MRRVLSLFKQQNKTVKQKLTAGAWDKWLTYPLHLIAKLELKQIYSDLCLIITAIDQILVINFLANLSTWEF